MARIDDEELIARVTEQVVGGAALVTRAVLTEDKGAGYAALTRDGRPDGEVLGVVVVSLSPEVARRLIALVADLGGHVQREVS